MKSDFVFNHINYREIIRNRQLLHVIDEALFKTFLHLFKNNDEHEAMIREEAKMKLEEFANEARAKSGLVFNCRTYLAAIEQIIFNNVPHGIVPFTGNSNVYKRS